MYAKNFTKGPWLALEMLLVMRAVRQKIAFTVEPNKSIIMYYPNGLVIILVEQSLHAYGFGSHNTILQYYYISTNLYTIIMYYAKANVGILLLY